MSDSLNPLRDQPPGLTLGSGAQRPFEETV